MDRFERKAYMHAYNKRRREEHLRRALAMMGEQKCAQCDATDNLEFDHIDPSTKKFAIGNQLGRSWRHVEAEVRKCQLLCYACHKQKSAAESSAWVRKHFSGDNGPRAKLTNEAVAALRQHYADGRAGGVVTIRSLAEQLDMAEKVVRQMLRGDTYASAGGPLATPEEAINYIPPDRKEQYRGRVVDLYRSGMTRLSDICKHVPVSSHTAKAYLVTAGLLSSEPKPNNNQPHAKLTDRQVRRYRERYRSGDVSQSALAREAGISVPGMVRLLKGESYASAGGPLRPSDRAVNRPDVPYDHIRASSR
jgi:hypothetical protein